MSSPTESTPDTSLSDAMFAAAVVVLCVIALAVSVHVFRGRRLHHGPFAVTVVREAVLPT